MFYELLVVPYNLKIWYFLLYYKLSFKAEFRQFLNVEIVLKKFHNSRLKD